MNRKKYPVQMLVSSEPEPVPVRLKNTAAGKTTGVKGFSAGDKLMSLSIASGYGIGHELDILGYFWLREDYRSNLYVITPGMMLASFRYSAQFPEIVIGEEVLFGELPNTIATICINDSARDFALVPTPCKVIQMQPEVMPEAKVIPMFQPLGGVCRQLSLFDTIKEAV